MNLKKLIDTFRAEMDDVKSPYLWSRELAVTYANDAQIEACRRARLLVESENVEIVRYPVGIGDDLIELDGRVISVRRAKLDGSASPLALVSHRDMDAGYPGWEDATGTPLAAVVDFQTGHLRLYPTPTAADTMRLVVTRIPCEMEKDEDIPEIKEAYHIKLVHWMKYRAYNRRDVDGYAPDMAKMEYELFSSEFGPPRPAIEEEWQIMNYQGDQYDGAFR